MLKNGARAGRKYPEKEGTDLHLPIRDFQFGLAALKELQELLRQVIHAETGRQQGCYSNGGTGVLQWCYSEDTVIIQW
jgi:hypothetical protein